MKSRAEAAVNIHGADDKRGEGEVDIRHQLKIYTHTKRQIFKHTQRQIFTHTQTHPVVHFGRAVDKRGEGGPDIRHQSTTNRHRWTPKDTDRHRHSNTGRTPFKCIRSQMQML